MNIIDCSALINIQRTDKMEALYTLLVFIIQTAGETCRNASCVVFNCYARKTQDKYISLSVVLMDMVII